MNTETDPNYREKTRLNNRVRHKNGRHYACLYLYGKEIWKSLKPPFSVPPSEHAPPAALFGGTRQFLTRQAEIGEVSRIAADRITCNRMLISVD